MISLDDFKKVEIKIGRVKSAEKVEGADKLLKLIVDFGTEEMQIISGIAEAYPDPSVLVGKEMPVVVNLEPREIRGHMSNGMILASIDEAGKAVVLHPEREVPPGSLIK